MGFGTSSQAPADSARLFPLALSKAQVAFRPLRFYGGATMRIAKQDVPVRIDVPGAIARQKTEFGSAAGYGTMRSEEHTSELQSLMRISYAVFCLKKKNQ